MLFSGGNSLLGLDVGSSMLKAVSLRKKGQALLVESAGIIATPAGAISGNLFLDAPAVSSCIRKLCRRQGLAAKRVAVSLAGEDVFVARLKVERNGEEDLEKRIRAEAARSVPFPLEQANVDYQVLEKSSDAKWAHALVVAVPSGRVYRFQDLIRGAGKTVMVVDSTACALANAFQVNYRPAPSEVTALVHLGAAWMTLCIVRGSIPIVTKDLPLAPSRYAPAPLDRIAVELERLLESMDEIADEHPLEPRSSQIKRLMLSGGGARMRGLDEVLRDRIGLPFEEMNPFLNIQPKNSDSINRLVTDHLHCMTVAVGLALRAFEEI